MNDQLVAETSTSQHTTLTTHKHPCPQRDLNPQSQQAISFWLKLDKNALHEDLCTCISLTVVFIIETGYLLCACTEARETVE